MLIIKEEENKMSNVTNPNTLLEPTDDLIADC